MSEQTAEAVLQHLHPIDEKNGFTSEIFMSEVQPEHVRPVRNVLTAGSSLRVVQRDRNDRDRYYLHGELYKTLARIRARELAIGTTRPGPIAYGGRLERPPAGDRRPARPSACWPTGTPSNGRTVTPRCRRGAAGEFRQPC